ncbi:MAG: hypothetical protein R3A11_03380 [Bdellovibrionota bacterium]
MKRILFLLACVLTMSPLAHAQTIVPVEDSGLVDETASTSTSVGDASNLKPADQTLPIGRTQHPSFNVRAGAGTSFDPQMFWMVGSVEAALDKFVAIGPLFQVGLDSRRTYFIGTFGPRLVLPISFFEVGLNGGLGFAYRDEFGFTFYNFAYQAGVNIDMYILKELSVGVLANFNLISSLGVADVGSITGTLSYHF